MNLKGAGWRWVDTRGESAKIYHKYNMNEHLKALVKPKPIVKLHLSDPTWLRRNELRLEKEAKLEAMPKGKAFEKMVATSSVFEEQRNVVKNIAKAKSGTN